MRHYLLSAEGATGFVPAPRSSGGLWALSRASPPSRTGLLTDCPSDLKQVAIETETVPEFRPQTPFTVLNSLSTGSICYKTLLVHSRSGVESVGAVIR
jgi:hypothetical protein